MEKQYSQQQSIVETLFTAANTSKYYSQQLYQLTIMVSYNNHNNVIKSLLNANTLFHKIVDFLCTTVISVHDRAPRLILGARKIVHQDNKFAQP